MEAIIEKAQDGAYGIYAPNEKGLFSYGKTEQEAKEAFLDAVDSQIEYYEEEGNPIPESLKSKIEWKYDLSGFFLTFDFFNVSSFAKVLGINPSLMRKYKERLAFASPKQKENIQKKYDMILEKLLTVKKSVN